MRRIDSTVFRDRRTALLEKIGNDSIAVIPAADMKIRNRDVEYYFRQDSDFYYLTGFSEPNAVLLLVPGREQGQVVLFCQDKNKEREIWDGRRLGPDAAIGALGIDDAFPIDDIDDILPNMFEAKNRIYYSMGTHPEFDQQIMEWLGMIRQQARKGVSAPTQIAAIEPLLHEQRLIKSDEEIAQMQEAANISVKAHQRAMQACRVGMYEYQLEAELNYEFHRAGARWSAYDSIVGAGDNACILHYTENQSQIKDGDLILIDAGCELDFYASDITRTFPANGRFTDEQAAIYQLVLDAQNAAFDHISPEHHWNQFHEAAVEVLTQGLIELGILSGDLQDNIERETYKEFYMHRTGHWLGMDVHDVGDYRVDGAWRMLEPGMVLTVEPGIYIAPDNTNVDKKWRGIGVRIEDDVVVTTAGYKNLTEAAPKSIEAIERLMADSSLAFS